MRNRSWRRHQRDRAIQRVLSNIREKRDWWYSYYSLPQPHRFWEMEERINTYPDRDHRIPPRTWEEVFDSRLKMALTQHSTRGKCSCICCGNPRKWWKEKTYKEHIAEISAYEQMEELGLRTLKKSHTWRPRPKWYGQRHY